jgi:hypothetical protein
MLSTFTFVTIGWVFFRSYDLNNSINFIVCLISDIIGEPLQIINLPEHKYLLIPIALLTMFEFFLRSDERKLKMPKNLYLRLVFYVSILTFTISYLGERQSFIYFQF